MVDDVPEYYMPLQVLAVHCLGYINHERSEVQKVWFSIVWLCTLE